MVKIKDFGKSGPGGTCPHALRPTHLPPMGEGLKGSQFHWILQNPREKLTVLVFWNYHSLSPESVEITNLVRKQFKNHYIYNILYEYICI